MDNNIYIQVFKACNIPVQPLPSNYSPEEYGRRLLYMSQNKYGVSYSASTDYKERFQNNNWNQNQRTQGK